MTKKALIVALNKKWVGISRLPEGLKRCGFKVIALCPEGSYLSKTKYLDRMITYRTWTYSRSNLIYPIILFNLLRISPDVLIPGDEDALLALQRLAALLQWTQKLGLGKGRFKALFDCIGNTERGTEKLSKSLFIERCVDLGIRAPKNIRVASITEAKDASEKIGYPVVVKFDFGYGASGVWICEDAKSVTEAFGQFKHASLKSKIKSAIRHLFFVVQDSSLEGISIQQFIRGQVGQIPFVALNGKVLADNSVLKIRTYPGTTGPTSVAKSCLLPEMKTAVRKVADFYNYNGFGSLDFIVDEASDLSYVIELNPRPTPICHFSESLAGVDLCLAYYLALNGKEYRQPEFKDYTVALFPNEQKRDPHSEFIQNSFYDVPLSDPALKMALETE